MYLDMVNPASTASASGLGDASSRGADGHEFYHKPNSLQSPRFDCAAIESHISLLHALAAGCSGVLILAPIWEGRPPRCQRFAIGAISAMVDAIMSFNGVPSVNLYAPWCVMRGDLAPGKKGAECDVQHVLAAVADVDNDKCIHREIQVEPSYVVETSPGNFQSIYVFARPLSVREAKPVLCAMHEAIGGDSAQKDCSHVWRIPGTLNWPTKSKLARGRLPEPAPVQIKSPFDGILVDPKELLAFAPIHKKLPPDLSKPRDAYAHGIGRLRAALASIPADERAVWRDVGMACHAEGLREEWDIWSRRSDKFDSAEQDRTWDSFKDRPGGITVATIFYHAKKRGWR